MSKKRDMYALLKKALDNANSGIHVSKMKGFMSTIKRRHEQLTLSDLRRLADELSYEFILDLLAADDIFDEVNDSDFNEDLVEEVVEIFLSVKSVGRRRAVL